MLIEESKLSSLTPSLVQSQSAFNNFVEVIVSYSQELGVPAFKKVITEFRNIFFNQTINFK